MPGFKRSPGMANSPIPRAIEDLAVCEGAHKAGSAALERAFREADWSYGEGTPMQRGKPLDWKRVSEHDPHPAPATFSDEVREDDASSEPSVHHGFETRSLPSTHSTSLGQESIGLPPTPPTMTNSDVAEAKRDPHLGPPPLFADGVRNALESRKPGRSSTPVNQQVKPLTPDPSPPRATATTKVPAMQQKEKPAFLRPVLAHGAQQHPHLLRQYPSSSRADSFKTAQEEVSTSPGVGTDEVRLAEGDALPQHWLDSTHALRIANIGLGDVTITDSKLLSEPEEHTVTPKSSRRRSRQESPTRTERQLSDWEKHISYVSGPDELEEFPPLEEEDPAHPATGLGLSGTGVPQDLQRSAEDINNLVYKDIREDNVKRHSVSSHSGAIAVGIVLPKNETTTRKLKRQTKCQSLRGDASSDSKRGSVDSADWRSKQKARPEDRRTLDDSPEFVSSIRQVSSPPALGVNASEMTSLTFASLQNLPKQRKQAHFRPEAEHKLRHFSHGDRLANNMEVRRTSLEISPELKSKEFGEHPKYDYSGRRTSGGDKIMNNIGIKRSNVDAGKYTKKTEARPSPLRGSDNATPADQESSPPSAKLRRFSRVERLENNDHVRRTSLGHSITTEGEVETGMRGMSLNKAYIPSSPRKSLDARFLQPSSTPLSTSQFSDRTDVEVLEASGVRMYPHTNESLVMIQQRSRPQSKDSPELSDSRSVTHELPGLNKPAFASHVDPPTPILGQRTLANKQLDSPLTNPRAAPEPPVFKFIPPTPNAELERELSNDPQGELPERRMSLMQRAKQYSGNLLLRTTSLRKSRPVERELEVRDMFLSPLWRPQGFWDDFDSDESEDEDDFESSVLPRGGDTSNVGVEEEERRRQSLLPRVMSKRLPGFRGSGGFLIGNTLGLDRHGTNNRRPYVTSTARPLNKRQSEELLKNLSTNARISQESLRRKTRARSFGVPFTGVRRASWAGPQKFRARMRAIRLTKEEREREKRRDVLRNSIGLRMYHETRS